MDKLPPTKTPMVNRPTLFGCIIHQLYREALLRNDSLDFLNSFSEERWKRGIEGHQPFDFFEQERIARMLDTQVSRFHRILERLTDSLEAQGLTVRLESYNPRRDNWRLGFAVLLQSQIESYVSRAIHTDNLIHTKRKSAGAPPRRRNAVMGRTTVLKQHTTAGKPARKRLP